MKNVNRVVLAGAVVGMLSLATHAMAEREGGYCRHDDKAGAERMEKMHERRQTLLHDSLQLTAEQEKAWTKFVASEKEMRPGKRPEPQDLENMTTPQRMEKMLERMREREARMSKLLSAVKEFYGVLTPKQKKIFDEFMPLHEGGGRHGGGMHGEGMHGSR